MAFGIIKNIDTIEHSWGGVAISASSNYNCQTPEEARKFAQDDSFITALSSNLAKVNDGVADISTVSNSIEFLLGLSVNIASQPNSFPFSAKTFKDSSGTVKKLYMRCCGIQQAVSNGSNDILYTIPYNWVKMTGVELLGGELTDKASLYVLDTTTGTYSTIPNYVLNQFGSNVNVSKDYHHISSPYDADLYLNMQIKVVYTSITSKTVCINFILNEVK